MTEQPPAGDQPVVTPPRIRRQSVRTVTQQPVPTPTTGSLPKLNLTGQVEQTEKPKRSKLGWPIRDTLIKACKQIALNENVHDYEVLEMFIEEAIERRKEQKPEV